MDNSFEDWVGQIKSKGKNYCKDCKMIALPEGKELCSFCDPNEFLTPAASVSVPVPEGVNPFAEGYEAGRMSVKPEVNVNPWKEVIIEGLVVCHIYRAEHEYNPRLAIDELIDYHCNVALDPRVSHQAEDLMESGRLEQQKNDVFFIALAAAVGATIASVFHIVFG